MEDLNNFSSLQKLKHYYRKKVKLLHPDKGGNKEEFLEFINWYEKIYKSLKDSSQVKVVEIMDTCPSKGRYLFSVLEFTVEEIALGGFKKVKVPIEEKVCETCKGTGKNREGKKETCGFCKGEKYVRIYDRRKEGETFLKCPYCRGLGFLFVEVCSVCLGKGKVKEEKEVFIEIPLGLREGKILFLSKDLVDSFYDLYFEVVIAPHPFFELKEDFIIYRCKIPFWEVILKKEITILTLEGEEKICSKYFLQEPPIILKGRGPFLPNGKRGDFYIDFRITVPSDIPKKSKDMIAKAVEYFIKTTEEEIDGNS